MTVVFGSRVVEGLRAAADRHAPLETGGLLLGEQGDGWVVDSVTIEGHMAADSFAIGAETLLTHATNPRWVGVWHSHPCGPARLSAADRRGAASWPRLLNVLVSPSGLACFAPHAQGLTPLPWGLAGESDGGRVLRSDAP